MKKSRPIILAAILFAFVLTFAACGSSRKNVVGNYQGTADVKDVINEGMAEADIALTSSVNCGFRLNLKDDGTFSMSVDTDSLMTSLKEAFNKDKKPIMDAIMKQQGFEESQFEDVAKSAGYESYAALTDEAINQTLNELDSEDLVSEEDLNESGTWDLDGKTITLKEDNASANATLNDDGTISLSLTMSDSDASIDITFEKE